MRHHEMKARPRLEWLERRALLAHLIPELRPIAFQVGRYVSITPAPDGQFLRTHVVIRVAPDGKSFVATRRDGRTGVTKLWTTTFDEATGQIVLNRTSRDGGSFAGVWTTFNRRMVQIDGTSTHSDGSTTPERIIIDRLGRGFSIYTDQIFDGQQFRTVETSLRRKV